MAYISLFRKYRSENFEDLVGQDHIVKTISNAIISGKIAQGYLFCGTRGTGKTTVARIIAKALNCEHGPTNKPCGVCHICQDIKNGSCIDVIEMDAASNRSVEDVERIVGSVQYRPTECRYKVYIIDEAHQLSNQAKDAFLKTLEEPPEYVVFILATTEAHKIPVTIRSRCQQFDFKRGSIEEISGRIKYVAEKEGINITDDAVNIIARNANGSYRDSLSILEQIIAFSGNTITPTEVYGVLGLVEEDVLFKMSEAILTGDIKQAFEFSSNLIDRGKDIKEVINNVATFYRDLLSVKINAYNFGPHYKSEAENYTEKQLVDIINIFAEAQKDLRISDQERLTFELSFLKAIESQKKEPEKQVVIEKIIEKEVVKPTGEVSFSANNNTQRKPLKVKQPTVVNNSPEIETQNNVSGPKRQIDFENHIRSFWHKFLNYVKALNVSLGQCLQDGVPTSYENEVLTITFKYDKEFQLNVCKKNLAPLENALLMCYKTPIKVKLALFPKPDEEPIQSDDVVRVAPPDLSDGAPIIEEVPPVDTYISQDRDLEVIDSVTIDNSALTGIDKEAENSLDTSFENEIDLNDKALDEGNDGDNREPELVSTSPEEVISKDDIKPQVDTDISVDNNISDSLENKEMTVESIEQEEKPSEQKDIDVMADSPLMDQQYTDHPKLEEVLSLFPDAVVETIRNK
ncbi:MAG: DNA polymerase III subunit gamma/tau [Abditibacteriota bacterium]|nr:DNA polymerase III subunit gamma/tau [Abditibacteriota bacterium]